MEPDVSVIIPTFNRAHFIAQAIESAMAQRDVRCEIIVVDDGSTDNTGAIVARYPDVRFVQQQNSGIGAARNRGVEEAHGRYLAFLDSDDLWTPTKLRLQLETMQQDPSVDVLYGFVQQFRQDDSASAGAQAMQVVGDPAPGYLPGTMLVKSETFSRIGPFGTGWQVGEAMDWHLRAVDAGLHIGMVQEVVLFRRLHDSNQGIQHRDARPDYARILKAALDRRRAAGATPAVTDEAEE